MEFIISNPAIIMLFLALVIWLLATVWDRDGDGYS